MTLHSSIIGWNARGLFAQNRFASLQLFVNSNCPLAVCITESRIDPAKSVPSLSGYHSVSKLCTAKSGGLLTFIRKDHRGRISFRHRLDLEHSPHVLVVEVQLPARSAPFLLVNAYHHRVGGLHSDVWRGIKRTLDVCTDSGLALLSVGDFNARNAEWDASTTDSFGTDLSEFCDNRFLAVLNSICCPGTPTFPYSGSTLDLAICSDVNLFPTVCVLDDSCLASDHYPIAVTVSIDLPPSFSSPHRQRTDFARSDWDAFARYLHAVSAEADKRARFQAARFRDHPIIAANNINELINTCLSQAASHAIPTVTTRLNAKNYWCDPAVRNANERVRAARKERERASSQRDQPWQQRRLRDANREWNAARSHYNRTVKEVKQRLWNARCERVLDTSGRQVNWKVFNALTQEPRVEIGPIASADQPLPTCFRESLNRLGAHYESVSATPQLQSVEDEQILKFVHTRDETERGPAELDDPFTLDKLNSVVSNIIHKAMGPDGISNLLVKHAPASFRNVLLFLFNFSWHNGVLPDVWRQAHTCALYKGSPNPRSQPKSYRPISLTSCVVKIFERMVLERLAGYLDSKRFFSAAQSGFRKHHSTLDQLYRLISRVQESFVRREHVSVAFLDIVSAFDCVWHEGLLLKLHKAGVTGKAWRWIKAFLSDRKFRVVADGEQSDWFGIGAGVPQGSILGPFLFLVFINDVPVYCGVVVVLFADDIAVWPNWMANRRQLTQQGVADEIYEWGKRWHVDILANEVSPDVLLKQANAATDPAHLAGPTHPASRVTISGIWACFSLPRLKWDAHWRAVYKSAQHAAYRISRVLTTLALRPESFASSF